MRLHDLGPLEVSISGSRQPIRGRQPAAILVLLVIHANRVVPVDALVDALWGDEVSAGSVSTLDSHVFRLRKQLEPGRVPGEPSTVLVRQGNGYRLVIDGDQVDSLRYARLVEEAAVSAASGRYVECLRLCDEALEVWRGSPGGVVADADWAQSWVARMSELRAQLGERRTDALIESGDPERALVEFDALIQEAPYREHLHALRMMALYRSGRTEDALSAFEEIRSTLARDLGMSPGPELQQLHQRILRHDAGLGYVGPADPPARVAVPAPDVRLPTTTSALVGREADLARVGELLAAHRLVTLTGTAGTGKTRLAVEVARRSAERYPDGVRFVDLASISSGDLVAEVVLSTVGATATAVGSPHEALRSSVQGRRMLLVVDNCEHVLSEAALVVSVLLGAGSDLTVLATSREYLELDGELILPIDPLGLPGATGDHSAAVDLFLERLEAGAPQTVATADPDDVRALAEEICVGLDGLPLAIELAAARARVYSLREIRDQVRSDPTRLARIGRPGTSRRQSLQAALDWGHRLLSPEEQLVHRRLAVLPGPFGVDAASATVGLPPEDLADLLPMLVGRSLLTSGPAPRPDGPTLFRQLVVVRGHATRALAQAGETEAALDRRDRWVAALATVASRTDRLELRRRYRRVDDDYAAVRAMLQRNLVDRPSRVGARMAGWLHGYWYYRGQLLEAVRWLELAVSALGAPVGESAGESRDDAIEVAWVHLGLAKMLAHQGRLDESRRHSERGLAVSDRLAPEHLGAFGLDVAIQAGNLWSAGDAGTAQQLLGRTAELAASHDDPVLGVLLAATRSLVRSDVDDPALTLERAEEAYRKARALELDVAAWMAARAGGYAALAAGDAGTGMLWSGRVIELHLREGGQLGGEFIEMRANFLTMAGDHRGAVVLYAAARAQRRREGLEWRTAARTDELAARARSALRPPEEEQARREGEELTLNDIIHTDVDLDSPSAASPDARHRRGPHEKG